MSLEFKWHLGYSITAGLLNWIQHCDMKYTNKYGWEKLYTKISQKKNI